MAHVAIDCRQHGLMVSSSIPKSAMGKERQTPDAGRERRPEACSIPPAEDGSPRQATCAFPVPLSIEGVRIPRRLASSHGPLPEPTARLRSIKQQERRGWADCVEEVGSSSRVATLGRVSALPLKRAPVAGSGSAWRACGGFGRWRRGGTRPWHHSGPAGAGGPASGYA